MDGALTDERYLVTGAYGCLGVWVIRTLLARNATVVALDVATGSPRLRLVLTDEHDPRLLRVVADITDRPALERVVDEHAITRVIHLAALQAPFCRADPPAGAAVNVVGSANVFEVVSRRAERIQGLVYASSVAVYDALVPGRAPSMAGTPGTIYGVYKRANEQMARLYADERGLASIGLRPHTVFGPARDQGLTSAPTVAMLAAAAGRDYTIPYTGRAQFQYAPDVADAFVRASTTRPGGAPVCNLSGSVQSMDDVLSAIIAVRPEAAGTIRAAGSPLAFPEHVESSGLEAVLDGAPSETPFRAAVAETIETFAQALAGGVIDPAVIAR